MKAHNTVAGITKAYEAIPAEIKETALDFVRDYATKHKYFGSEAVCDAYKGAGLPCPAGKGWRDSWGGIISRAKANGWIVKCGRYIPASGATHMDSTSLWMSRLYDGDEELTTPDANEVLEGMRKEFLLSPNKDLRALLWKMYDYAFNAGLYAKMGEPT